MALSSSSSEKSRPENLEEFARWVGNHTADALAGNAAGTWAANDTVAQEVSSWSAISTNVLNKFVEAGLSFPHRALVKNAIVFFPQSFSVARTFSVAG